MDAVEIIIEWAKKERHQLYREIAYKADMDYYDLKEDHKYRVQRVQELLEENRELREELDKYDDRVCISQEKYVSFLDAQEFLNALREFGVDNWNGYSDAIQSLG